MIGGGVSGLTPAWLLAPTHDVRLYQRSARWRRRASPPPGLQHLVHIELRDYRHIEGQYSRIVSVEMIEAVGRECWPDFFRAIDRALAPGGRVGLQAITMPDGRFDGYLRRSRLDPEAHLPRRAAAVPA